MSRIRKRPQARRELLGHYRFIAEHNPAAAERFYDAVEASLETLAQMPRSGRRWQSTHPHLEDIRVWPVRGFRKYLVFYRPLDDGIEVLHVFHGARDIPELLKADEA